MAHVIPQRDGLCFIRQRAPCRLLFTSSLSSMKWPSTIPQIVRVLRGRPQGTSLSLSISLSVLPSTLTWPFRSGRLRRVIFEAMRFASHSHRATLFRFYLRLPRSQDWTFARLNFRMDDQKGHAEMARTFYSGDDLMRDRKNKFAPASWLSNFPKLIVRFLLRDRDQRIHYNFKKLTHWYNT